MGAARHRSCLISALVVAMLSAVSPPAAQAQQSVEDFRQSLLDLAATLDSQGGSGGAFALQQDVAEASPEAIELIQQELARQGSPNAVEEALQHLTPPPQVARLSTTGADVSVTEICTDAKARLSPPLVCPLSTTAPANCPADAPFPISKVLALQISVQTFDAVAIGLDTICSFDANFLNVITNAVIAGACIAGGVTHGIINGLELSIGLNNICGGGEKEADLQAALLASLAVETARVRQAGEQAGRVQAVLDREIEIALRTSTKLASLQLPARIEVCPAAAECVRAGGATCPAGIYPAQCSCKSTPSISCSHRLDCATPRKICVKTCTADADCGSGVACLTLPSGTRICSQDVSQACTTNAQCTTATPSCVTDEVEVGGQLDAVVDLVQRRLQQAQAAGGQISPAVADFNTARERICTNMYQTAFGFLEKTYTSLSSF
jgi:hypothetical protein